MNGDTLILAAFVVFVLLLGWRVKARYAELQEREQQAPPEERGRFAHARKWWKAIQLLVLCGLLAYMVPFLWSDFHHLEEQKTIDVVLRCLIFVFTIYVLGWEVVRLIQQKNKGKC